jgi:hypothetical protein
MTTENKDNEEDLVSLTQMTSYRISIPAMSILKEIKKRFSTEAKIRVSEAKIIELMIFYFENRSFKELLQMDKK